MKARSEATSDSIYSNDSFEGFTSSPNALKFALNGGPPDRHQLDDATGKANGFATSGVPSTVHNYGIVSEDFSLEKKLQPLHFDTDEALEETPAILKSLNSGRRGPDTFVYLTTSKPSSLPKNDDPFKTFVISSEKTGFVDKKNCSNETLPADRSESVPLFLQNDCNEYLSYVIEKEDKKKIEKMSQESCSGNEKGSEKTNEVDCSTNSRKDACEDQSVTSKSSNRSKETESEICDRKVQQKEEEATVLSFDRTLTDKKEQAFAKLQDELQRAHQELRLKDEEVARLSRIREDVERELEDLTASLFQEAHKMVSIAKEKQAAAEKSLKESQMKVEVLTAEVVALKTLVLTSTPSRPNPHLHPQIGREENVGGVNLFARKHRRSPSHFNLKYGRENSPPGSPIRDEQTSIQNPVTCSLDSRDMSEVDPTVHKEFLQWTSTCKLDKTDPFIDRIYREDINLCLDFSNRELAEEVQKAIETRNIYVEAVTDKTKTIFPRKCALLEVTRQCHYRMKLGDQDTWYNISQMCRNRIIAVCDFINYLRYIELGLVKSSAHDMYWEIMRLRKEMVLARLGLSHPPS